MRTETIHMTVTRVSEERKGPFGVSWTISLNQPDWDTAKRPDGSAAPPLIEDTMHLSMWTDPALHVGDRIAVLITPLPKGHP